nr:MAG TPA: Blasticidin M [Caudoviricetes sp.]
MKKLFISVPMKGRTEEEIKSSIQKMKKIAEAYVGEELELIDSYIEDSPPQNNNQAVWYLGESLKKLAQADVFIGIEGSWCWNGCHIERITAEKYGIKTYTCPAEHVIDNYSLLLEKKGIYACETRRDVFI